MALIVIEDIIFLEVWTGPTLMPNDSLRQRKTTDTHFMKTM